MRRSMLFLPGNTPNMLINGNCLGSDAIIFDLEDAVSPAEKDAARICGAARPSSVSIPLIPPIGRKTWIPCCPSSPT